MKMAKLNIDFLAAIANLDFSPPNDDQITLLAYIITDNYKGLKDLLAKKRLEINYFYNIPYKKTALQFLCSECCTEKNVKSAELLIKHGANIEQSLDSAVQGGNPQLLLLLIDHLKQQSKDYYQRIVILEMIKFMNKYNMNQDKYVEILSILIESGFNVNACDVHNITGVFLAAKSKYDKLIPVFLTAPLIDLDIITECDSKTAREYIVYNNLYQGKLPYKKNISDKSILNQNLRQKREQKFIENYTEMKANLLKNGSPEEIRYYYICEAAENGLEIVVKYLLCDGVNLDLIQIQDFTKTPLYCACLNGYHGVVHILLKYSSPRIISFTFVQLIALRLIKPSQDCHVDYHKCFQLFLENDDLDINHQVYDQDHNLDGKTALYYAIVNQSERVVLTILHRGASLVYLYPWKVFLDPPTFMKYLNESIVPHPTKNSAKVQISSLLPAEKDENEPETKILRYLGKNPDYHIILHHPLVQILLSLKWKTVRTFYDVNLIIFLMFGVSMILYVVLKFSDARKVSPSFLQICLILIMVSYVILIFRELLQIYIFGFEYFTNIENFIELGIMGISANILYIENVEAPTLDRSPFIQMSAVLMILIATEYLILFGRQSPLLFISINISKIVSKTLIGWLYPYTILIFAFAGSFFFLFQKAAVISAPTDNKEEDFWAKPYKAFIRTVVMLTGEFEVENLDFDPYPIVSPIIFFIYVFWMNIILFGVSTALAFGETQILMRNAAARQEIYRIEQIANWERLLRKNKTIQNFLKVEKLFKKNNLIIRPGNGRKVYILNNPDPYKRLKRYLPEFLHCFIELICRDDLPYIVYLDKKVIKDISTLIEERKQLLKQNLNI